MTSVLIGYVSHRQTWTNIKNSDITQLNNLRQSTAETYLLTYLRTVACKVEDNREFRVHVIMPVVASSTFRNSRSVLVRRSLPPGRYVVVVSTFEPGVIGSFLLRIYYGGSTKIRYDEPVKRCSLDQGGTWCTHCTIRQQISSQSTS